MTDTTSPRQKQDPAEVIAEAMWMHETDGARWEYAQTNFAPKLRERAAYVVLVLEEEGYAIVPVVAARPGR